MQTVSPADARTQIIEVLGDSVYHALGLKVSLEEERKALEKQDMEAIESAVGNKEACVLKLKDLDAKRGDLCNSCGFARGPDQMQQLIDWCDEDQLISDRWEHLLIIAAESSALNMTNGAIIRVRQQQFENSLSVLRGVAPGTDTYGQNGAGSGEFSRRSLAQA